MISDRKRFINSITESANRAEATALLIRGGYRVYKPEADIEGEDLVVRAPPEVAHPLGELRAVQLKGRPVVDKRRYGDRGLWMLFPSGKYDPEITREWYLVSHDPLYLWVKERHGKSEKWGEYWSFPSVPRELQDYLREFTVKPLDPGDRFVETGRGARVFDAEGNEVDLEKRIAENSN